MFLLKSLQIKIKYVIKTSGSLCTFACNNTKEGCRSELKGGGGQAVNHPASLLSNYTLKQLPPLILM